MSDNELTPLAASATQLHELFIQLQAAGFSRQEALRLVGQILGTAAGTQPKADE